MDGYIKLYRQIQEHWLWDDPDKLRAWLDLMLMVNYKEKRIRFNGEFLYVKPGQIMTSLSQLATRWGWSREKVRKFLTDIEQDNMVDTKRYRNGTLITLVNYRIYQMCETQTATLNETPNRTLIETKTRHEPDTDRDTNRDTNRDTEKDTKQHNNNTPSRHEPTQHNKDNKERSILYNKSPTSDAPARELNLDDFAFELEEGY